MLGEYEYIKKSTHPFRQPDVHTRGQGTKYAEDEIYKKNPTYYVMDTMYFFCMSSRT